jgi:molecular chaperone DnaK (HSP70)
MRIGIDLGTTRTMVAASDRGNYPVVGFTAPDGDVVEYQPTLSAEWEGRLVHGLDAEAAARAGAPVLRSWKRLLGRYGPQHPVAIGSIELSLLDLATDFLRQLGEDLLARSNVPRRLRKLPEVVISVPANAGSSQRFTTLDAFRRAGFPVAALLNEPSAAGLEYAHRFRNTLSRARDHVAVYDLGGGTFDAALVCLAEGGHDVVATAGIAELGGDDFDARLLELALETAGIAPAVAEPCRDALLLECRAAKEALTRHTRRLVLELAALGPDAPGEPIAIPVPRFEERIAPLVERTLESLGRVMRAPEGEPPAEPQDAVARVRAAGVYVVGGASALPLVSRLLRDVFGRRLHRSVYPSAATAIGLAIAAEAGGRAAVRERLTRDLGVFRERDAGEEIVFDPLFAKGTPVPRPGDPALVATRRYRAGHNVGHFRFAECDLLDGEAQPLGDLAPHGEVLFPLAPEVRGTPLERIRVERLPHEGHLIEERYEVDAAGTVAVEIRDLEDGFAQRFRL